MNAIDVQHIRVGYDRHIVLKDLSVSIPKGRITAMIGPNGCGKSTLLKTIARILKPTQGTILLHGKELKKLHPKEIARNMAFLPQSPATPAGLTVKELVAFGRFPYQKPFGGLHSEDLDIMDWAMKETGLSDLRDQYVDALSGGQRQRAWIAMALAQNTDVIVLDEPTTYLDIAHQLEILELLQSLNQAHHQTIVMVLHELNMASRYGDHIIAMKDGQILFQGSPNEVITTDHLYQLYGIHTRIEYSEQADPICIDFHL